MEPYYEDDQVTLYHGEAEDVLPTLEAVDHFIADPPYSEHVHSSARSRRMQSANARGGRYGADLRRNVDLGFAHLSNELRTFLAGEAARLTERWVLVFSDTEGAHLWAEELQDADLDYVRTGAWIKRGATPQFSGDRPATGHEAITICHPKGRKRWNGGGQHAIWDVPIVLNRARASKSERIHPTQKPLRLMQQLVTQFTDPGDLILDPTAGGATTGVAAKLLGRRAVLVERDEKHCEAAARRLAETVIPELVPVSATEAFDFAALAAHERTSS
ncbi:DNA-methyltransferase [Leucobacter sp. GX24907]